MNDHNMLAAAFLLNNRNQNQDGYRENPLSTREMYAVRKPRRSTKQVLQQILALVATLKNRLPQRGTRLAEQPRIKNTRQASLS